MPDRKLSTAKSALLKKWLKGQPSANEFTSIPQRPPDSPLRLSFPQQRRLFLEMLDRDTAVNNLSTLLKIAGPLSISALQSSAEKIMARHETLRTRFSFGMGLPVPEILESLEYSLPIVDLTEGIAKERNQEAQRLAEAAVLQPFDLRKAPLIRLRLYKLGKEDYLLLLVAHHVIADGWSLGVLLKELMSFYQGHISGKSPDLPDLKVKYYDFAHWQTNEKRQAELQPSLNYWKKKLSGELPTIELPTDRVRLSRQTFRGGTHRFELPKELISACEEFGRQENATLFMTFLSVFYLLLHRYCGQDDFLIGSPIANRTVPELEPLIGVFINTIVLRGDLGGNPSFRELLRRVREDALEAYSHQDLPFEQLVKELKPQRDLNRTPIFQIVFNLQNVPLPKFEITGLETTFLNVDRGVSQFDMTLMFSRNGQNYHASVEYNADLFDPASIDRMFQSYQQCLKYAINQPDTAVSQFPLVPSTDWQQMVEGINQTHQVFPRNKCIHHLIEEQVESTPDATAIISGETKLTYEQLNRKCNILAHRLKNLGVGPENRVGILIEKSLTTVVALLAILKAGGAYVPIHRDSPAERIKYILQDVGTNILLTNIDLGPTFSFDGHLIDLRKPHSPDDNTSSNPASPVHSENLAYIIYTSGSTGAPKGVMMNHYSLVNFLWSMQTKPGMNESSVVLALTPISFDPSTLEVFLPLIVGAKIVIPNKSVSTNPILLSETIQQHKINFLQATPITWKLLLGTGWTGNPNLIALCGGDILTRKMADDLLGLVGALWNVYGPTETTVWSMCSRIKKDRAPITVGLPINNMQVYILDRYQTPVPIGVVGELHIAGEGLSRGYLNQPDLTQQQFIFNNFNPTPEARLYKTGDLARFLPNYEIEIIGRKDDQVKVQGNRIELGEINASLSQHSAIDKSIVLSFKESPQTKGLVAYYIPLAGFSPTAEALRSFLRKKLPTYMIPAYFMQLEDFPLLTSGKINRKALPPPKAIRSHAGYASPSNEDEQVMARIWQSVLGIESIGIHDNFFELGGASIQSIQIVAKATMYGYPISIDNIFEFQTIEKLMAHFKSRS